MKQLVLRLHYCSATFLNNCLPFIYLTIFVPFVTIWSYDIFHVQLPNTFFGAFVQLKGYTCLPKKTDMKMFCLFPLLVEPIVLQYNAKAHLGS